MNAAQIIDILKANRTLLDEFHVKALHLFGSTARGEERPDSDVDMLVEFEPDARIGLFAFMTLKDRLSDLLGAPVDLATPDALHPALKGDTVKETVHVA